MFAHLNVFQGATPPPPPPPRCNVCSSEFVSGSYPTLAEITTALLRGVPENRKQLVAEFVSSLYKVYSDLFFTYLEINPLGKSLPHLLQDIKSLVL